MCKPNRKKLQAALTTTTMLMRHNVLRTRPCDRGGELTHATAAPGVFNLTTSDATNNQVDPSTNVEGKAQSRNFWIDFEIFSRLFR